MDPLELLLASHELTPVSDRGLLVEHDHELRGRLDGPGCKFVGVLDRVDGTLRLDAAAQETPDQRSFWLETNVSALHRHTDAGKLQAQQLACARALVDVLVEQKALRQAFAPHLEAVCARDVPGAVAMGLEGDGHLPLIERVFKKIRPTPAPAAPKRAAPATSQATAEVKKEVKTEPGEPAEEARPKAKRAKKEKTEVVEEDGTFYVNIPDEHGVNCTALEHLERAQLEGFWEKRKSAKTSGLNIGFDPKLWPRFVADVERALTR